VEAHILVVDDDVAIRELVREYLVENDFQVSLAENGADMDKVLGAEIVDLVILDLKLPDEDGLAIARRLRESLDLPIIILTGRKEEADRVMGLELGADDYVTKPFSLMELLARVASVLRRATADSTEPIALSFGDLEIDLVGQVATRAGKRLELPSRAFAILKVFAKRPGEVVSRDVLLDEAWGYEDYPNTRTVDNHIMRLRQKLEKDPSNPLHFRTVHSSGYKFVR
jgi:two-component system alkaline phosphatase synthesis response regulator PhoP